MKSFAPLLLTCCLAVSQAQEAAVPRYEVKRAKSRINIDGTANEKAWQDAGVIELMFPLPRQTGKRQKTTVRLLWDDNFLYAAYDCADEDITAQFADRDDPTYRDDAVELFLNPKPSQTQHYFGMEMNARATLYDYLMALGTALFKNFDLRGQQIATNLRGTLNARGDKDDGWSLELAVPWANFEGLGPRPKPGTEWSAQMNRWDGTEPDRVLSMWSDPGARRGAPHVPERFGTLVFVE